ncbi:hypothetical protein VP01_315g4 [Puccinia sorghi]|uniref:Uncharacterized protein n=1 Tax=Puccinia sorghi TaxID=27349 RepID=A0A0L6UZ02_9BASI|nr:hypothetical protein VP01_315g4 [Puccinia sorghi]
MVAASYQLNPSPRSEGLVTLTGARRPSAKRSFRKRTCSPSTFCIPIPAMKQLAWAASGTPHTKLTPKAFVPNFITSADPAIAYLRRFWGKL